MKLKMMSLFGTLMITLSFATQVKADNFGIGNAGPNFPQTDFHGDRGGFDRDGDHGGFDRGGRFPDRPFDHDHGGPFDHDRGPFRPPMPPPPPPYYPPAPPPPYYPPVPPPPPYYPPMPPPSPMPPPAPSFPGPNNGNLERQEVWCRSVNYGYIDCPVAGQIETVRLMQQYSPSECREGYSFGRSDRGIWADRGCEGLFEIYVQTYRPAQESVTIGCSSSGYANNRCETGGFIQSAVMISQQSRSACIMGSTWGYDATGIWVSGGCRAMFQAIIVRR